MAKPPICAGVRLWPSASQPSIVATSGLRKPSEATAEGSMRDKPRNQSR